VTGDELERLLVVVAREYGQARVALEQSSLVLDAVLGALEPDAQDRVVAALRDDEVPAGSDRSKPEKGVRCPSCETKAPTVSVFGGVVGVCPRCGEFEVPDGG